LFSVEKKSSIGFADFYFQLKKKEIVLFYQFRFPKKPGHSDFAQTFLIIFHCALDFFGRMPKRERCFLLGFSLAIFQKNEHSLVAIEQIITSDFFFNDLCKKTSKDLRPGAFLRLGVIL
jgi:hypothetical protein